MIASVHVADIGALSALRVVRRSPRPADVAGLRHAQVAIAGTLSASVRPAADLRRAGLVAFWDDEAALDRFLDHHPLADRLVAGWQVRLEPVRLWGSWPGVPDDIPKPRTTRHDGPAVVLTLGRLRLTQARRFLHTSAKAEGAVVGAAGLTWATGLARPPFVATCSLWETAEALSLYAYGQAEPAHTEAVQADRAKPFHHRSAFIRFRPLASRGSLDGTNPLAESWLATT